PERELARGQRLRVLCVLRLLVDPDVDDVLARPELSQAHLMLLRGHQGELVLVVVQGRVVDDLRPLLAVDVQLLPDRAGAVGAHLVLEVAAPDDGLARGEGVAQGAALLLAAHDVLGREDAIAVAALALDLLERRRRRARVRPALDGYARAPRAPHPRHQ